VNADLSIHRMAFREAESLGVAVALVAKKRQEMELRILREKVLKGDGAAGATLGSALNKMDDQSAATTRVLDPDLGSIVDKTA
jgi:hypothetical protein